MRSITLCGLLGTMMVLAWGCADVGGGGWGASDEELTSPSRSYSATTWSAAPTATEPSSEELPDKPTLSDYLVYAALNNPELEAAFNRWKAALERVPQVRALPDPRFTYGYFIEEVETRVGAQRQSFGLAQTFPWFGTLELRGDVATQAANAEHQRYEVIKLSLFFRVKEAYYEYYYLGRAIAITDENVQLMKYLEGVARARYRAAAAGHPDVIRAQVELGKLDDRLRSLQELKGPLVARLNAVLNRAITAPLPLPDEIPEEKPAVTDKELFEWLSEANPELKALDFEAELRSRSIELAKKRYFPDVTLGVNYIDTADAIGAMRPSDSGDDPVIASVSVNVPIWWGKLAAGVREARARYRAARRNRTNKENILSADLKLALYKFRDAERKIDLYRDTLLPKAKQAFKTTEASYRAGKAVFTDLIDAQRILLEFQLAYRRALADHARHLANVETLVGREIPRKGNGKSLKDVKNGKPSEGGREPDQ